MDRYDQLLSAAGGLYGQLFGPPPARQALPGAVGHEPGMGRGPRHPNTPPADTGGPSDPLGSLAALLAPAPNTALARSCPSDAISGPTICASRCPHSCATPDWA